MKCCNRTVTTPFCPYCGNRGVQRTDLYGLLRHCEAMLRHCEATAYNQETAAKTAREQDNGDMSSHTIRKMRAAEKWRSWATLLSELLERSSVAITFSSVKDNAVTPEGGAEQPLQSNVTERDR